MKNYLRSLLFLLLFALRFRSTWRPIRLTLTEAWNVSTWTIIVWANFSRLVHLDRSSNRIESIDQTAFVNCALLEYPDLSVNNITRIPGHLFFSLVKWVQLWSMTLRLSATRRAFALRKTCCLAKHWGACWGSWIIEEQICKWTHKFSYNWSSCQPLSFDDEHRFCEKPGESICTPTTTASTITNTTTAATTISIREAIIFTKITTYRLLFFTSFVFFFFYVLLIFL